VRPADADGFVHSPSSEAATRAQNALDILTTLITKLTNDLKSPVPDTLRDDLRSAAQFGVSGSYVFSDSPDLLTRANATLTALNARATAAKAASSPTDIARAVFGNDFLLLPEFVPTATAQLQQALATPPQADTNAPRRWLQQLARVRPPLGKWRSLWMYAGALGVAPPKLDLIQLPQNGARWAALDFQQSQPPPSGTLSMALHRPVAPAASQPWVGLLVDEWNEIIPTPTEQTAVAFRFANPGAEAAQAVLLAVPPGNAPNWSLESLVGIVRETLTLAKIRLVAGEQLDSLRPFLPAMFVAENMANETISTDFTATEVAEPIVNAVPV
jgi:hypothetical protein